MNLPTPISPCFTVVGGDPHLSSKDKAWEAAWLLVSGKLNLLPPGSIVIHGPQKGSPDVLAAQACEQYGHINVCLDRDGRIYASAKFSMEKDTVSPYKRRDCGVWADRPTPETLSSELAHEAALKKAAGWDVRAIILHGWDGSWRGERLAEHLRHLGVEPMEWDISESGEVSERKNEHG